MTRRAALVAVGAALLAACGSVQEKASPSPAPAPVAPPREPAHVRFVHASAPTPAVDISIGSERIVENLQVGGFTPQRIDIAPGEHEFDVRAIRVPGQPMLSAKVDLAEGAKVTLVLLGDPNSSVPGQRLDLLVVPDPERAVVPERRSLVRFVHAIPGGPVVDLADANSRTYVRDLGYRQVSGFVSAPAQTDPTRLVAAGRTLLESGVPYAAGRLFTVVLMPQADGYTYAIVNERP
jgi:hypothetical protein